MIVHDVDPDAPDGLSPLRLGIPTASNFKKLITSTGAPSKSMGGYAKQLAGDLYAGRQLDAWEGDKYSDRGNEIEPLADAYYQFAREETKIAGFVTNQKVITDAIGWGCSPDRFVGTDGLAEYKCFPKLHLDAILYYKEHRKCQPSEVAQVQGQLFITGCKWCDLLYFHQYLPKVIIRIYPDLVVMASLARQLKECITLRDEIVEQLRSFDE